MYSGCAICKGLKLIVSSLGLFVLSQEALRRDGTVNVIYIAYDQTPPHYAAGDTWAW